MQLTFLSPNHPQWSALLRDVPHDIYHLPGYLTLEAQRLNTLPEAALITEGAAAILLPYLLRSDRGALANDELMPEVFDVASPYGYAGFVQNAAARDRPDFVAAALQTLKQGLQERGVCSAFFRLHPILDADLETGLTEEADCFQGETVSIDLSLTEADLWSQTRRSHRSHIKRARREGLTARIVPWQEALPTFVSVYFETMSRVGAADRYLEFDEAYFAELGQVLGDRLHLCLVEKENAVAAAGLYTEWHGIIQAIFGGTRTAFLKLSPSTLETYSVALWAQTRGCRWLHLGGGVGAGDDPLFCYKSGFSKQRHRFHTLRLITNTEQYHTLVNRRARALSVTPQTLYATNYFPTYRAAIGA
ncbi:GNAT family N-acetyltransferase [Halomicronema sp. CCY15110]|uniref:GNAT family N-acetyltransferase n=1 Tax=Halomicronema sp. CCY15110 TaxID=2767773 RepID=UPI0019506F88|nr:GNAT family N-acetyltransferase [Halomicronema sp. CCY15110]